MATGNGGKAAQFSSVKIKEEPNVNNLINNTMKFASFSLPRDLTLGGTGIAGGAIKNQRGGGATAKKVYTPNLNVTRNKKLSVKTSVDTSKQSRNKGGKFDKKNSNSNHNGGRTNLIQTTGVFSDGVGGPNIRKSSTMSSNSYRSDGSSANTMRKPVFTKGNKLDSITTNNHQDNKYILDDSSDEGDLGDQSAYLEYIPVKLSKKENESSIGKQQNRYGGESTTPFNSNLENFFIKKQTKLFIMQMPDCLPYKNLIDNEAESSGRKQICEEQSSSDNNDSLLKDFQEGQIGKLIRYKSGKYKMILGSTYFDVELGVDSPFTQEIVSVSANREERSGNIINLGDVQAKINIIPDWKQLTKHNS